MALPRGMFRRGAVLWARKDVPKALRAIIGKTSLQESLGTGDLNRARVVFHEVMRRFEAIIADARGRLANQFNGSIVPIILTAEQLGLTQEHAEAYFRVQQAKPENQMRVTADRIERKLVEAGLAAPTPEPTSMEELFQRWVRARQPRLNSQAEYRRAKNLFIRLGTNKPIAEYTSADARKFKDHVATMNAPDGKPLGHGTERTPTRRSPTCQRSPLSRW